MGAPGGGVFAGGRPGTVTECDGLMTTLDAAMFGRIVAVRIARRMVVVVPMEDGS